MTELFVLIGLTLAVNGLLLGALTWAFRAPQLASARIQTGPGMQVPWPHRLRAMSVTSALSFVIVLGATYLGFDALFTTGPAPIGLAVAQAIGILVVYDFAYYFAHRAMHHPRLLKHVHGVHRARNPSALESLYQHPAELVIGLALLFGATAVVAAIAPVYVHAFALTFFLYSTMNVLVHSGMGTKRWWLRPVDFLTRKHHVHHHDDPTKNYSTLTPLPDLLFGTAR